jgi:uncharacterized membrane protein YsdA (DUF1294 family)/cold shock CspA family protein
VLTMRVGEVVRWDNDRGFGFIAPDDGGSNVFLHISDLTAGSMRPHLGDRVDFALERDERGRMHASHATVLTAVTDDIVPPRLHPQRWSVIEMLAVLGFAVMLATGVLVYDMSVAIPIVVGLVSLVTAFAYADDKRRAKEGRWRTSESSLLLLCLLGGWPGAITAMRWYRHKTTKASFIGAFWVTVFVTLVAFTLIAFPAAREAVITSLELMSAGT